MPRLVAIDTGTGEANFERSKGSAGQYHSNLKAAGIDRNAVDIALPSRRSGHFNGSLTDGRMRRPTGHPRQLDYREQ